MALSNEQIKENIARTGLPNPDFNLSSREWFTMFIWTVLMVAGLMFFIVKTSQVDANTAQVSVSSTNTDQVNTNNTAQAGIIAAVN